MQKRVVVLGSTNWDISVYLPHLPQPGETVAGGRLSANLGGKGANQAIASLRAGAQTEFVSCLGDDDSATQILTQFEDMGLSKKYLHQVSDCSTGTACIFVDSQGENSIGLSSGANAELSPEIVEGSIDCLRGADLVLMQLEVPIASVLAAARLAAQNQTPNPIRAESKEKKTVVVLNPAPASPLPEEIYSCLDLITPNRGELAQITSLPTDTQDQLIAASLWLIDQGVKQVVVTLGKEGVLLVKSDKETSFFSSYSVVAKDTTAAGDCFNGYLAACLAELGSCDYLDQVIPIAIAAAALSVTREGAIPSIPRLAEVAEFQKTAQKTEPNGSDSAV